MKKIVAVATVLALGLMIAAQPAMAGKIGKRQIKQEKRIAQGIKCGELTRGETRFLFKQQNRIQRHKRRAWSDGELTRRERIRLEMHQDKASASIYRFKHNDRNRL